MVSEEELQVDHVFLLKIFFPSVDFFTRHFLGSEMNFNVFLFSSVVDKIPKKNKLGLFNIRNKVEVVTDSCNNSSNNFYRYNGKLKLCNFQHRKFLRYRFSTFCILINFWFEQKYFLLTRRFACSASICVRRDTLNSR